MSFWSELKRRNVYKVGVAYAIVAWLIMQIVAQLIDPLSLPERFDTIVIVLLAIGFPVALLLAWAYDLTPEGIERAESVPLPARGRPSPGTRLNLLIAGLAIVAAGIWAFSKFSTKPAPNTPTMAIVPFTSTSANDDNGFLATGLWSLLCSRFRQVDEISSIECSYLAEYLANGGTLAEIGEFDDRISALLQANVLRVGDQAQIDVQLIDVATRNSTWNAQYETSINADDNLETEDLFAKLERIVADISGELRVTLSPDAAASDVPTLNDRALNFYLRGQQTSLSGPELLIERERLYQAAVDEDPGFALAHAALADSHLRQFWQGVDRTEARRRLGEAEARLAMALAPDLPEAQYALGNYYYLAVRDWPSAMDAFRRAENLSRPASYADAISSQAYIHRRMGEYAEALTDLERAIDETPLATGLRAGLASTYLELRRYDVAEAEFLRMDDLAPATASVGRVMLPLYRDGDAIRASALMRGVRVRTDRELDFGWLLDIYSHDFDAAVMRLENAASSEPDALIENTYRYAPLSLFLAETYRLAGREAEAREEFGASASILEPLARERAYDNRVHIELAVAYVGLGRIEAGLAVAETGLELLSIEDDARDGPKHLLDVVIRVYVPAGEYDLAIDGLDTYLSTFGEWSIEALMKDPRLEPLLDHPAFAGLVEKYGRR